MNRKIIVLLTIMIIAPVLHASATIIIIPDDYSTIQEGIDASIDGDTVLVRPGTYVENINFNGHNITLGSLFLTTGDTSYIPQTIIDGDSSGSVVTFDSGEDGTTAITGFTIQNGYAEGMRGGGIHSAGSGPTIANNSVTRNLFIGIYCSSWSNCTIISNIITENSGDGIFCWGSNPTIDRNTVSGNSGGLGGGISCRYSDPSIFNNTISGNSGILGGGIYCHTSGPAIRDNMVAENLATDGCGGIRCDNNSNAVITGNVISGNSATVGGIFCWESDPYIANNRIIGNSASPSGGGICCLESSPIITNNTVTANSADASGAGIYCALVSNPEITNTILWGDRAAYSPEIDFDDSSSPTLRYCDIQGGWAGEGNIDTDPLFRDPENGNFHLMSTACGDSYDSPCIDAGDPAILDSLLDCSWGLGELRSDMGAYGGGDTLIVGIDDKEIPTPDKFILFQNYPNPFNATTVIRYSLPEPADIKIEIFDILGRRVETIIDEKQEAGYHHIVWNCNQRSAGIYLYRIEAGDYSRTRKMVLLK